ncbi:hypothetical protein ACLKA6_000654 [Drosophila palustris]
MQTAVRKELPTASGWRAKHQWRNCLVEEAGANQFHGEMKARADCCAAKRRLQRYRGRPSFESNLVEFRIKRKKLRIKIIESKSRCFQELCDAADAEPFGGAYRLVMGKLIKQPMPTCATTLESIVRHLFPQQPLLSAILHLPATADDVVQATASEKPQNPSIRIGSTSIVTKPAIKHLGLMIDHRLKFKDHLQYTSIKASHATNAISRMLVNTRGPSHECAIGQPGPQGSAQAMRFKSVLCFSHSLRSGSTCRSWNDPTGSLSAGTIQRHSRQQSTTGKHNFAVASKIPQLRQWKLDTTPYM